MRIDDNMKRIMRKFEKNISEQFDVNLNQPAGLKMLQLYTAFNMRRIDATLEEVVKRLRERDAPPQVALPPGFVWKTIGDEEEYLSFRHRILNDAEYHEACVLYFSKYHHIDPNVYVRSIMRDLMSGSVAQMFNITGKNNHLKFAQVCKGLIETTINRTNPTASLAIINQRIKLFLRSYGRIREEKKDEDRE